MVMGERKVIVIPAKPELAERKIRRQLRVAAYCRVSTEEEEQQSSYEAQCRYYTDKIMTNPDWTMAGIFADEGITGTSAKKRPEFLRMIQHCRQRKIDIVLTKSISRFSRNTVDCLQYIRILKGLGIAVIFEKENINTLESDSEMIITLLGAFAQAESESISQNVRWGIRQAMREGRTSMANNPFAYQKEADGSWKIIPEQAEIVRRVFARFLAGDSLRMIRDTLNAEVVPSSAGKAWESETVRIMLTNEKYCGDVLMQKTYVTDCISKKTVKNTGQLPMYLIQNHHEAIVSRAVFDAAQAELARRNALKSPSQKTLSGKSCYTSKYALSERLVCGECGTLYRRCSWTAKGQKRFVWRCVSRLDYGKKYCHNSPTMDEVPLQQAILAAINRTMGDREDLVSWVRDAMEQELIPAVGMPYSLGDIERQLSEQERRFEALLAQAADAGSTEELTGAFKAVADEMARLKQCREEILAMRKEHRAAAGRIQAAADALKEASPRITQWDESTIRQLVTTVKVVSAEKIIVYLKGGIEAEQEVDYQSGT